MKACWYSLWHSCYFHVQWIIKLQCEMKGVPHRRAQSYVQISCVYSSFLNVKWSAKSGYCVCAFNLAHICLLLVAYDSIQPNLQTDLEICAERGLIELKDWTWLYLLQSQKAKFASPRKTLIGSELCCCFFILLFPILLYYLIAQTFKMAGRTSNISKLQQKHIHHVDITIITLNNLIIFT